MGKIARSLLIEVLVKITEDVTSRRIAHIGERISSRSSGYRLEIKNRLIEN